MNKNIITIINHANKTYWTGSIDDFFNSLSSSFKKFREKMMESMTPEQREAYEKMMEKEKSKKLSVKVKKTGKKEIISGYEGINYQVYVNGNLEEELWVAEGIDINKEVDFKKFREFSEKMKKIGNMGTDYSDSPEYEKITEKGYPVKSITYSAFGISSITTVIEAQKKNISHSEFKIPAGYRRSSFQNIFKDVFQMEE